LFGTVAAGFMPQIDAARLLTSEKRMITPWLIDVKKPH